MTLEKRDTRFKPGTSGNPSGPKRGSGQIGALRKKMAERLEEIITKLVDQALEGDVKSARLVIERVIAPLRAEAAPVVVPGLDAQGALVAQAQAIMTAAATGKVSPDTSASLLAALASVGRIRELEELEKRIAALEQKGSQQ